MTHKTNQRGPGDDVLFLRPNSKFITKNEGLFHKLDKNFKQEWLD